MKREVIEVKVGRQKTRVHYILFDKDAPFKHKAYRTKDGYQRKPKHRKAYWAGEE